MRMNTSKKWNYFNEPVAKLQFGANPRLLRWIRISRKVPMASRICHFARNANQLCNHRIWPAKRVLQLALTFKKSRTGIYDFPTAMDFRIVKIDGDCLIGNIPYRACWKLTLVKNK